MKLHFLAAVTMIVATPVSAQSAPARKGQGVGVVTAIDAKAAKITIRHGAIPAVGWPAMTMTFRSSPPALLNKIRVGQTIAFDVNVLGMDASVTAIKPR